MTSGGKGWKLNGGQRRKRVFMMLHPKVIELLDILTNAGKTNRSELVESLIVDSVKGVGD